MNNISAVKTKLFQCISELAQISWMFCKRPGIDFSRKRKLDFETLLHMLISMESSSLRHELLKFFRFSGDCVSASAFLQQRDKLLPEALLFLFHEFNAAFPERKTDNGYRLIACDGSDLSIARNPDDVENYFENEPGQLGFNQLHLNALFDLCSKRYLDAIIQPGIKNNECKAMIEMVDRSFLPQKTIFMADRGYESYNVFAHIQEKGHYYLIRARDSRQSCILAGLKTLPAEGEYDETISLELTRKQTKQTKADTIKYKRLAKSTPFDYLDLYEKKFYPMTFRVVRFLLSENAYECVITNLPKEEFPPQELKRLYQKRWGIETSFRELKYAVGLSGFHAKKVEYIKQEIFARLILYNFCEIVTSCTIATQQKEKHFYQPNYTMAIRICRDFLGYCRDISPPDVEVLLKKCILPVRPGRNNPRKVKAQSAAAFLYRAT